MATDRYTVSVMKKDLHPSDYRLVVFRDTSNGAIFLTKSTTPSTETTKWEDGQEYPLVDVHISSASHPFYTGKEKLVDIEGRVDRFKAKREAAESLRAKTAAKIAKTRARSAAKQAKRTPAKTK